jgi:hypothetical protein
MTKLEFNHALTGKPEAVIKSGVKTLTGYRIRDMLDRLYVTNMTVNLNGYRWIESEKDDCWFITESFSRGYPTQFIIYKTKQAAEAELRNIQ